MYICFIFCDITHKSVSCRGSGNQTAQKYVFETHLIEKFVNTSCGMVRRKSKKLTELLFYSLRASLLQPFMWCGQLGKNFVCIQATCNSVYGMKNE